MDFKWTAVLGLALLALTCSKPTPPPDPGVENAAIGIRLSAVPEGFQLSSNQGSTLELTPADEGREGTVSFVVGQERDGINLVAAVTDHQSWIEGLPEGDYKGGQELQGDFGAAFYSRGRFFEGATQVEETVLFLIHPAGNRLLEIHYRYPAGDDSASRVEELIGVLAEVE